MESSTKSYIYRATILLDEGCKYIATFLHKEIPLQEILDYVYNRHQSTQSDLKKYKIEKLYTLEAYHEILTIASVALTRAERYQN